MAPNSSFGVLVCIDRQGTQKLWHAALLLLPVSVCVMCSGGGFAFRAPWLKACVQTCIPMARVQGFPDYLSSQISRKPPISMLKWFPPGLG